MTTLRLLIVDDEPWIRTGIRDALTGMPGIEVVGECGSCAEAVERLHASPPDVVLLDVQLQDGTGFDVIEKVDPQRMPPVIFITAFDEYAVRAFQLNAIDYVLKPFDEERLRTSVERARSRLATMGQEALVAQFQALLDQRAKTWVERLAVRRGEAFDFIQVESIDWIESADNYVELHCGPAHHLLSETLSGLEGKLDPGHFVRVHRRRIVNVERLASVRPMMGGAYEMLLRDGTRLTTGRQYRETVQRLIRNVG